MMVEMYETGKTYQEFRNMNGSRIYMEDGKLCLVISYDDMQENEIEAFEHSDFDIVFKTFRQAAMFTFRFHQDDLIVDAPFDPLAWEDGAVESVEILVFESSDGLLLGKRVCGLPEEFSGRLYELLTKRKALYGRTYDVQEFNREMKQIYDNHVIEEIYELPGDQRISCMAGNVA